MLIVLDPGHGGRDPGAVHNNLKEKNTNLEIALRVGKLLSDNYEVGVEYTRVSDVSLSIAKRLNVINRADVRLCISFHSNGFTLSQANGYEDFIHNQATGVVLGIRDIFHEKVSAVWREYGRRNRGKKRADFLLLRKSTVPAILVENGFLSNLKDSQLLRNGVFIDKLVKATAEGIVNALELPKKTAIDSELYRVQVGAFENRTLANSMLNRLKMAGFKGFITK